MFPNKNGILLKEFMSNLWLEHSSFLGIEIIVFIHPKTHHPTRS